MIGPTQRDQFRNQNHTVARLVSKENHWVRTKLTLAFW